MDREYLKKHNLWESHQKFLRLVNEGYLSSMISEDEEDDNQDPNAMGGAPDGGMGGDPNAMGGGPDAMGGADMGGAPDGDMGNDPNAMGGDPNAMGGAPDGGMGEDPNAMGGGPDAMGEDPMGGMDEDPMGGMPPSEPEDDNTVIDVEDIVKAQEKLNNKENEIGKDLGSMTSVYQDVLTAIESMKKTIDAQNQKMSALSSELEKRIPTQKERLAMQSLHSYPYNVDPNEFWNKKEGEGVYQATNGKRDQENLEIKRKVIDNYSPSEIEDSFENPSTKDIFKGFY